MFASPALDHLVPPPRSPAEPVITPRSRGPGRARENAAAQQVTGHVRRDVRPRARPSADAGRSRHPIQVNWRRAIAPRCAFRPDSPTVQLTTLPDETHQLARVDDALTVSDIQLTAVSNTGNARVKVLRHFESTAIESNASDVLVCENNTPSTSTNELTGSGNGLQLRSVPRAWGGDAEAGGRGESDTARPRGSTARLLLLPNPTPGPLESSGRGRFRALFHPLRKKHESSLLPRLRAPGNKCSGPGAVHTPRSGHCYYSLLCLLFVVSTLFIASS